MEISVNGETIPRTLFEQERDRLHLDPESPPYDEIRDKVRDTLIARALIRQAAIGSSREIPPADVESSLADLIEDAGGEDLFYRRYGITSEQEGLVVEEIEITLKIEQLLKEIGKDAPAPTGGEIAAHYHENPESFIEPETAEAMHVVMNVHCQHDAPEVYETMRGIRADLLAGADFEELAVRHSVNGKDDRGRLGTFKRGEMLPEFEVVAFSMTPGEISPVFQTQFGYHVIKVIARTPRRRLALEECAGRITEDLLHRRRNELIERWVEERRKTASISIVD